MNRAMILPACIAAGLHVALLGFRSAPDIPHSSPADPEPDSTVLRFPDIEPPDPVDPIDEFEAEETKPSTPIPQQPENPTFYPKSELQIERLPTPGIDAPNTPFIPSDWQPPSDSRKTGLPIASLIELQNTPRALLRPAPARPPGTGETNENVTVEFVVGKDGRVMQARVIDSSDTRFEDACLRAIKRWRFEPGIRKNVPVAFRMQQTFVFTTHD